MSPSMHMPFWKKNMVFEVLRERKREEIETGFSKIFSIFFLVVQRQ